MLRIVPRTAPSVCRSCEHFSDGLELHHLIFSLCKERGGGRLGQSLCEASRKPELLETPFILGGSLARLETWWSHIGPWDLPSFSCDKKMKRRGSGGGFGRRTSLRPAMTLVSGTYALFHLTCRAEIDHLSRFGDRRRNLTTTSIYNEYSTDPCIGPICTRNCFTLTNIFQMCMTFH